MLTPTCSTLIFIVIIKVINTFINSIKPRQLAKTVNDEYVRCSVFDSLIVEERRGGKTGEERDKRERVGMMRAVNIGRYERWNGTKREERTKERMEGEEVKTIWRRLKTIKEFIYHTQFITTCSPLTLILQSFHHVFFLKNILKVTFSGKLHGKCN